MSCYRTATATAAIPTPRRPGRLTPVAGPLPATALLIATLLITTLLIVALPVTALPVTAAAASDSPPEGLPGTALETRVTMLVGFPEEPGAESSVLVVPGTVIPQGAILSPRALAELEQEAEEIGEAVSGVSRGLARAVGLGELEVAYRESRTLAVSAPEALAGPGEGSRVSGRLTLLGFNADLATYRVELYEGSTPVADTKVAVERGERAIIGGLDGEQAPYFFVVLEPAGAQPKPVEIAQTITPPRPIETVAPKYTEAARKQRITGVVILQAVIDREGRLQEVKPLRGLPEGLTEAAVAAISQWRFEPARDGYGNPVAVFYNLTVNFRLDDEE